MREERRQLRLLTRRYNEALEIVKNIIGEEEVEILMEDKTVLLDISYYDEEWLGLCIDREYYNEIKIRYDLFYCSKKKMLEVLIHEIIHTFSNTNNHDVMWLYYADMITSSSPYHIYVGGIGEEE